MSAADPNPDHYMKMVSVMSSEMLHLNKLVTPTPGT